MKRLILLVALISMISAAGAEPPYGCYKQLRWGMTPEIARKTLAATESRTATKDNIVELIFASFFNLNNKKLDVTLFFKNDKLFKVQIDFPADDPHSQSCLPGATERVAGYAVLKEALNTKYGKAKKTIEENKSPGTNMEVAICRQSGKMESEWETANSKITLSANLVMLMQTKPVFAPLLVYIDKTQLQ